MREAIILAGGMGTRLRQIVSNVPKPMAPIGGKPFLHHILKWLSKYDLKKVIISAGYKSDFIVKYFGDSFEGISIVYALEEKPLGTGGAVKFALGKIAGVGSLILNGDTWFPIDLDKFWSVHKETGSSFSIALKRMKDFSRYGSVEWEGNTIIRFNEKKICKDGFINGGIYLADRQFIESKQLPEIFSLEKDLLEKEVGSGLIKCQVFDDTFIDIGIPEDYRKAQQILKPGK
jgi:D-glycero-alpha-D-manno-heptose 1-phosphate guanylyltransferase